MERREERLERVRWTLTLAALALLIAGLYLILRPFLVAITWAVILVLSAWPLHSRISRALPRSPNLAAALTTFLLTVVLLALVIPLAAALARQIDAATGGIIEYISEGELPLPPFIRKLPVIGPILEERFSELRLEVKELPAFLSGYREQIVKAATLAAKNFARFLFGFFVCLFTSFFLFRQGRRLAGEVSLAAHRVGGEQFVVLLAAMRASVKGSLYGILATALAQGVLAGVGFVVAGAPVPLLLGLATAIFSLVPFGTPLVYFPVAIYIALSGRWVAGSVLALWGIAVVSTADNFLRPFFISQATRAPVILVFFGVIGGVFSFGLLGMFLGPALLAVAHVLWREWVEPSPSRSGVEVKT